MHLRIQDPYPSFNCISGTNNPKSYLCEAGNLELQSLYLSKQCLSSDNYAAVYGTANLRGCG